MPLLLLSALALAQSIPNGGFDTSLASWQTTGGTRHDGGRGFLANGCAALEAKTSTLVSAPFVVTREQIAWADDGDEEDYDWVMGTAGGSYEADGWRERFLDVSNQCGDTITVAFDYANDEDEVYVDDVRLHGAVCPDFADRDDDGACIGGVDLDDDGDCADDGEQTGPFDCAEDDPTRGPFETEGPADGVDSNCDDLEECYDDSDGDGLGDPSVRVQSAPLDCSGPGVSDNGDDQCPEGPDDLDDDGDGIPNACDPTPFPVDSADTATTGPGPIDTAGSGGTVGTPADSGAGTDTASGATTGDTGTTSPVGTVDDTADTADTADTGSRSGPTDGTDDVPYDPTQGTDPTGPVPDGAVGTPEAETSAAAGCGCAAPIERPTLLGWLVRRR